MKSFLQRFGSLVLGILHGFDRLRFRGSKRLLCYPGGVSSFLSQSQVPLKDYKSYAKETTVALCKAIETEAKQAGLYQYLNNSQESKEETALRLAAEHGRQQGLDRGAGLRRALPGRPGAGQQGDQEAGDTDRAEQMPSLLPLLPGSGLRPAVHAAPELVPVHDACGTQRPGLAGSADDQGRPGIPAEGQLFHVGRGLRGGPTTAGPTIDNGLGVAVGRLGGREPSLVAATRGAAGAVLLVGARGGIRHRHRVSHAGGLAAALSAVGAIMRPGRSRAPMCSGSWVTESRSPGGRVGTWPARW